MLNASVAPSTLTHPLCNCTHFNLPLLQFGWSARIILVAYNDNSISSLYKCIQALFGISAQQRPISRVSRKFQTALGSNEGTIEIKSRYLSACSEFARHAKENGVEATADIVGELVMLPRNATASSAMRTTTCEI